MRSRQLVYIALGLLMIVAIIELSLVSTTVGYLHHRAKGTYAFVYNGVHQLKGEPKNFILNQGHTTNAASGTAFILVGLGGCLALFLRARPNPSRFSLHLYRLWLVINGLSLLLTFAALIYVFVVTNNHKGQRIDPRYVVELGGRPYNRDSWTPQNWFAAVLKLDLVDARSNVKYYLRIMRGWQWNLVPFFIIHFFETLIAFWDAMQERKRATPATMEKHHVPIY